MQRLLLCRRHPGDAGMWLLLALLLPLLTPLLAAFAMLVAVSRVALGVHDPSDVQAGALIGLSSADLLRWLAAPLAQQRVRAAAGRSP